MWCTDRRSDAGASKPKAKKFTKPIDVPVSVDEGRLITTEQICAAYDKGQPLHFKAYGVISDEALSWTHDSLIDKVGEETMSIAVRTPHVIEKFGDLSKVHGGRVTIKQLVQNIREAEEEGKLSKGMPGFGLNIEEPEAVLQYCGHVMGAKTGKPLYAHENVMKVGDLGLDFPMPLVLQDLWTEAINMLWLGPSAPDLHQDSLDNVLFQIQGTKRVWVYAATDTTHFPLYSVFDTAVPNHCKLGYGFRFPEVIEKYPMAALAQGYVIDLQPGDALCIPAYALHAAMGSIDSISVNSFLVPNSIQTLPSRGKWDWMRSGCAMCVASIRNPTQQIMDYDTTTNTNSLKAQKDKEDELAEERRRLKMERGNENVQPSIDACAATTSNRCTTSNEHEVFEEQDLFFSLTIMPDPNSLNKPKEKGDELAQEISCAIPVAISVGYIAVPCADY